MTPNEDQLNLICIVGLIVIGVILVIGILTLQGMGKPIDNALIVMASGITGGLGGYLGAHSKKGAQSNVDAGNAENVNITNPPAVPAIPADPAEGQ